MLPPLLGAEVAGLAVDPPPLLGWLLAGAGVPVAEGGAVLAEGGAVVAEGGAVLAPPPLPPLVVAAPGVDWAC